MSDYLPIADHGLIGDLHSAALIGTNGTIDWYCCPRFDSPRLFGSILDARRGGRYRFAPAGEGWTSKQLYLPDTNVLITRFLTADGVGEIADFMPMAQTIGAEHRQRLVSRVVAVRGQMRFELECAPRFDYARAEHTVEAHEDSRILQLSILVNRRADSTNSLGAALERDRLERRVRRATVALAPSHTSASLYHRGRELGGLPPYLPYASADI